MGFHHIFGDAGRGLIMDETTGVFEVDVTWFNEWMSRYVPTGEINEIDGTATGEFMSADYNTGILLETRIKEKLNHGGYTGTGQNIWDNAESRLPLGGVSAANNTALKIENNVNLKLDHTNGIATHLECVSAPVHPNDVVRKSDLESAVGAIGLNVVEVVGEISSTVPTLTLAKTYSELMLVSKDLTTGVYETSMTIFAGTIGNFATNDSGRTGTVTITGHLAGNTVTFNNDASVGGDNLWFIVYGKSAQVGAIGMHQGPGIIVTGLQVSHADTSNQINVAAGANHAIKTLNFDDFGHVTWAVAGVVATAWWDVTGKPDLVLKAGDTMTGNLSAPTVICPTSFILNGYTITVEV